MKRLSGWPVICAGVALAAPLSGGVAVAQRASENAITAADDAFGTRVGNESIGLYGQYNARGFSPVSAGNVRIEGLYFDQQTQPHTRISRGVTVRVGISAQAYALPAPSGIADYSLRIPGDKQVVSTVLTYGPWATHNIEIDAQFPLITDKFSLGLGVGAVRIDNDAGFKSKNNEWSGSAIARLRPSDTSEVIGFFGMFDDCNNGQQPGLFTAGPYAPPRFKRHTYFGQDWSRGACRDSNTGVLGRVTLPGDWTLRAGGFRSGSAQFFYGDFLRNIQPDGTAQHSIFKQPEQSFVSYSGEIRASKIVSDGARRHTVDFVVRARDVQRQFGGADVRSFGIGRVGVREVIAEPVFTPGAVTDDHTRQKTVGVSYAGLWAGVGGIGIGAQKSFYRRDTAAPGLPVAATRDEPWLVNLSANALLGPDFALYLGYARGLEETGTAPFVANNRGEAMPASITRQRDAGLRYAITPNLRLVAGVFEVKRPYFNVNTANVYGPLGQVRHRGVEVSLTGRAFTQGLTIVGGLILLQPRVSGDTVARGLIGPVPLGQVPRTLQFSVQYQPPAWGGFSIDSQLNSTSDQVATADNSFKIDGTTMLNIGARYRFKVAEVPASVRAQV